MRVLRKGERRNVRRRIGGKEKKIHDGTELLRYSGADVPRTRRGICARIQHDDANERGK